MSYLIWIVIAIVVWEMWLEAPLREHVELRLVPWYKAQKEKVKSLMNRIVSK